MQQDINDLGLRIYLHYEDKRYPTLVMQSDTFGSVGYSVDLNSGELIRTCICHARCDSECVCGYSESYSDSNVP